MVSSSEFDQLLPSNLQQNQKDLEKEASHALEEIRIVLPGVQALFGFQLIAIFNQTFHEKLSFLQKTTHLGALGLVALATVFLMTPAAYHRQRKPHRISKRFVQLASTLLTGGLFCLAFALGFELFLIGAVLFNNQKVGLILAGTLWTLCMGFWFLLPRIFPKQQQNNQFVSTAKD